MRATAGSLAMVLTLSAALSGCQTIEEHPKTAIGTGVGAAGGALAGGLIGRDTTGVVVGGLVGALAGGAIGYYLDRRDRTASQAAAETGYTPAQGTVVRVERAQADPPSVRPGQTVNLAATYTILTPNPQQTVTVNETREVRHDGVLVANPTTAFSRDNGTYTSVLPITLPRGAARGNYEVTTTVTVEDRSSRGMTSFAVQ